MDIQSDMCNHFAQPTQDSNMYVFVVCVCVCVLMWFTITYDQELNKNNHSVRESFKFGTFSSYIFRHVYIHRCMYIPICVLQCLSYQFPCALQLKQWGILKDVKCRLCEKYYRERNVPEPPDSVESVGHIQCYCPALQLPRIAIHHGIWRELMFSIRKSSTVNRTKRCLGNPMLFSLSSKPRSPCGMGFL